MHTLRQVRVNQVKLFLIITVLLMFFATACIQADPAGVAEPPTETHATEPAEPASIRATAVGTTPHPTATIFLITTPPPMIDISIPGLWFGTVTGAFNGDSSPAVEKFFQIKTECPVGDLCLTVRQSDNLRWRDIPGVPTETNDRTCFTLLKPETENRNAVAIYRACFTMLADGRLDYTGITPDGEETGQFTRLTGTEKERIDERLDSACRGIDPSQFHPGDQAMIGSSEGLEVFTDPGGDVAAFRAPAGTIVELVNGPLCAGPSWWWWVLYNDALGWLQETSGGTANLTPVPPQ